MAQKQAKAPYKEEEEEDKIIIIIIIIISWYFSFKDHKYMLSGNLGYAHMSVIKKIRKTQVVTDHFKMQVSVICCWHTCTFVI
jgi:hypothetical protein